MSGDELERFGALGDVSVRRSQLSDRARRMLQLSVPKNTLLAYEREWPKFLAWCAAWGESPLPAASDTLTNWVAERCAAGHSESIIKQGIAAVVFFHDQADDEEVPKALYPDTSDAWRVVRWYHNERVASGWRPDEAAAFTVEELRAMCAALPDGELWTVQARAVLTLGTTMFARRSILVGIDAEDVSFSPDGKARVFVSRAKEDQWARGRKVPVSAGSHPLSDPVGSVAAWRGILESRRLVPGPLFRKLNKTTFGWSISEHRMYPGYVGKIVKRAAAAAGLEAPSGRKYRAHSLRASGATIAFDAGRPAVQIARDGGWSEKGNQVHAYNRPETHDSAMDGLL